jgi:hypothetical protein
MPCRRGGMWRRERRERWQWPARALGVCILAAGLCLSSAARAVETPADVQTDHVDPTSDGPHTVALWLRTGTLIRGWLGGEVDVALDDHFAMTAEADAHVREPGYRAALGLSVYPLACAFHRLYVHPFADVARVSLASLMGAAVTELGAGATLGAAFTAPFGGAVRAGLGLEYARATSDEDSSASRAGVSFLLEGDFGWVF